ncbi:hypothetical protein OROGR_017138 [Orobanche gracilis]
MGKQDKQDQSAQRQMNAYEKNRLLRIKENQARLEDLGVKSIAKSLTSLVESQQTKKRQVKPTYTGARDEQMKNYEPLEDGSASVDPFMVVMNKERDGYRRLYGRGVTNKMIKKVGGGDASYMIPRGVMESLNTNEAEKNKLLELRKEIQEDHERKKAELEAMRIDIDNQQKEFEARMRRFMIELPRED